MTDINNSSVIVDETKLKLKQIGFEGNYYDELWDWLETEHSIYVSTYYIPQWILLI